MLREMLANWVALEGRLRILGIAPQSMESVPHHCKRHGHCGAPTNVNRMATSLWCGKRRCTSSSCHFQHNHPLRGIAIFFPSTVMAESNGPKIVVTLWVLTILPLMFMLLRIYCKARYSKLFGWDDILLALAWVGQLFPMVALSLMLSRFCRCVIQYFSRSRSVTGLANTSTTSKIRVYCQRPSSTCTLAKPLDSFRCL
jgi:hypothetical protein